VDVNRLANLLGFGYLSYLIFYYKLHQVLYTVQQSYARSDGHILLSGTVFVEPRASGGVLNNALRIYFVIAKCKPLTTETITHTS
jgi:hypothetical protein